MNRIPFENSKFEKVRIRFLISEKVKSKIQVSEAKSQNEAQYPFFTSGENILSFDKFLCDDETIFLNTGGNASVKFYNGKASYSTDTYAIESKNQNYCLTKFLFYCLNDTKFINDTFFEGSALKHLQKDKFKNFRIPLPPLAEQERIAEFLDKKCASIDSSIENLEQKTKSLAQYKKALITQCVTKGLNPKILEFKDSGIPWIRQIPKHWEISKIKYVAKIRSENSSFNAENDKYIGLENVAGYLNSLIETNTEYENSIQAVCKKGDILFGKLRPYLSKVIIAPFNCFCSSEFLQFINLKCYFKFFYYFLLNKNFIENVNSATYGAKMPRANSNYIMNLNFLVPPLNEQKEIAEILDKKCKKIDNLSANYKEQIKTLKEYKKALIYECVTGKKQI